MWTSFEWPPIEWFTGSVEVAHGMFHLLPAARKAKRLTTVFDLTTFRYAETHRAESAGSHVKMLRHAAKKADALIAISQSCRTDIMELLGIAPERVHVVYGGVFTNEFSVEFDSNALTEIKQRLGIHSEYFIHLGTLEPRKNIPRLLQAYARVRDRFLECPQLVLVGKEGWGYDPIFQTIQSLNLSGKVVHAGYVERDEAVSLLRGAYACLYPSLYEGFGLPVLEAMAAHTPVLTSNVSSLPEVIGDTGIQVNPESVDEIETGMIALIEQHDQALLRADAAYERAKTFTWENSARTLANVYRQVAGR